jgi:hypothetical protein
MGWSDGALEYWSDACGMINRKEPSAAKPQPKKKQDIHHEGREDPSAAEPQPKESEYLPQRRKGRKEKRNIVLNLAFLAPWRE